MTYSNTNLQSYLCNYVKDLIYSVNEINLEIKLDEYLLWSNLDSYLIDCDYIVSICVKYNDENNTIIDYFNSCKILSKNLKFICHHVINKNDQLSFNDTFPYISHFIEKENDLELIKTLFQNSASSFYETLNNKTTKVNHEMHVYASLLNLFVIFERYLRQLVSKLSFTTNTTTIESSNQTFTASNNPNSQYLLRDLIANNVLESALNKSLINLIKLFIGSPHSLNLRNLLWHGFLQLNECSHYYECFLLLLLNKIGFDLKSFKEKSNLLQLNEDKFLAKKVSNYKLRYLHSLQRDSEFYSNLNEYLRIIDNSSLINSNQMFIIKYTIKNSFKNENFIQTIILLLPLIEFLLRKLFIIENKFDLNRNLCAQEKMFYLTMDEILVEYVDTSHIGANATSDIDIKNNLCSKLGDSCMILIHDLFMYNDGPRLRDRFSHGEYDLNEEFDTISEEHEINGIYALICIYLTINLLNEEPSSNLNYKNFIDNHQCMYHPLACIKYDLIDLIVCFDASSKIERFLATAVIQNLKLDEKFMYHNEKLNIKQPIDIKNFMLHESFNKNLLFLYSNNGNKNTNANFGLQIISIMKHLIKECYQFCMIFSSYNQTTTNKYENKELRSRQRENYIYFKEKALENLEIYMIKSICFVFYLFLNLLNNDKNNLSQINVKLLRKLLSVTQNLQQQSKLNRWLECNTLVEEFDAVLNKLVPTG